MNDLEMYREQLAICDDKIIDALVERNAIIEKIMAYKETYGMPILQPAQEAKQERRLNEKLQGNKYSEEIHDVFQRILRNSKRIQARKLFSYNIVLIGFMGAGKTTISDYLSTMFDMRLVEMDQEIAEREEMSIPDIFATYGEEYFRGLETKLLKELQTGKNCCLRLSAPGRVDLRSAGSAVCSPVPDRNGFSLFTSPGNPRRTEAPWSPLPVWTPCRTPPTRRSTEPGPRCATCCWSTPPC